MSLGRTPLEFSDPLLKYSGPASGPLFSPTGDHIAYIYNNKNIIVRDVQTMSVVCYHTSLGPTTDISWSPNGKYVLNCMPRKGHVTVYKVVQDENEGDGNESSSSWIGTLTEGLAGVSFANWSPNGSHVLVASEFQVKLTAWSLSDGNSVQLMPAKHDGGKGVKCSPEGSLLAVLSRKDCKDFLVLYDVNNWECVNTVSLPTTDAADCEWCPDSTCLAVWDSISCGNMLVIISVDGTILATKTWESQYGLGIKCVSWSPSGQVLVVGSHDVEMPMLNYVSWSEIARLKHGSAVGAAEDANSVTVYVEEAVSRDDIGEIFQDEGANRSYPSPKKAGSRRISEGELHRNNEPQKDTEKRLVGAVVKYRIAGLPLKLPLPRIPSDEPNPKVGVEQIVWCPSGKFFATKCEERPHVVWIWNGLRVKLESVLIHTLPVRSFAWSPDGSNSLVVVTGSANVFQWTPEKASCARVSTQGKALACNSVSWSARGDVFCVAGKEQFSCGYLETLAPC